MLWCRRGGDKIMNNIANVAMYISQTMVEGQSIFNFRNFAIPITMIYIHLQMNLFQVPSIGKIFSSLSIILALFQQVVPLLRY